MSWIPLPIGIDNFEKVVGGGYYFVDKTLFIKELLDMKGEVNLFTRPRRFGKTLNMSMLRYFFENGETDNKELFRGLKIMDAGEEYLAHMGKYPVISPRTEDHGRGRRISGAYGEISGDQYIPEVNEAVFL